MVTLRGRSFYHRVAIAGVLVAAVGTAIYAALAIPAGDPKAPLFAPAPIVLVAVAVLMRRTTKALWLAAIGGPIVLGVVAIDPFRLTHPDSFIDFVPSLLSVAGTAVAFVGSAAALRGRSRPPGHSTHRAEHAVIALGIVGLVAVSVYSAAATFTRPATASLPGGRTAIVVEADEDRWIPDKISVDTVGETLVLVRNPDWIAHTFVVDALGIDTYVAPRGERIVEVPAPAPGTYQFECGVTGHEAMVGTLRAS